MEKTGVFSRIRNWAEGIRSEFKKITWPSGKTVEKQTVSVIILCFILGVLIAVIDFIFQFGLDRLFSL